MALIVTETIESTQAPLRGDSSGRSLRQNPRKKRHFDEIAGSPPPPQPRKKRSPVPKQGSKIEKGSAAESAARVLVSYSAQAHQESPDESLVECEIGTFDLPRSVPVLVSSLFHFLFLFFLVEKFRVLLCSTRKCFVL